MPRKSSKQALKSHLRKITTSNQNRSSTSLSNEAPKPSLSVSETLHRLRLASPNPVKPSGTSSSLSNPFPRVVLYPPTSSLSHDTAATEEE
ncbi:hypothetical protein BKA69DRAFT_1096143 [Paraphysoderma sedebokerense]|nr:hypothetical protein BKA69DRAFT_1096143 [Paraphysoderma sedebokerense]